MINNLLACERESKMKKYLFTISSILLLCAMQLKVLFE